MSLGRTQNFEKNLHPGYSRREKSFQLRPLDRYQECVTQGSAVGPDLWNILYDGLLRLELPPGVTLEGFADDVALTVEAHTRGEAEVKIEWAVMKIDGWLRDHGLELAGHKTKMVVLNGRAFGDLRVRIGDVSIGPSHSVRYLIMGIDDRLTFVEHTKKAAERATKLTFTLAHILPNVRGPREVRRRLLISVTDSILLYRAEVWTDALSRKGNRNRLLAAQRVGALRIACAYRTVSVAAVMVIARLIPVVLLARERREKFLSGGNELEEIRRARTMDSWQSEWEASTKGRWTYRLIPVLRQWLQRKHGEVNYYLTQPY